MATRIGGWNLTAVPRWYTTDDRFIFQRYNDKWTIVTLWFSDQQVLEDFFGGELEPLSLAESIQLCHQLTGCSQRLYRKQAMYEVEGTPLCLEQAPQGWTATVNLWVYDRLDKAARSYWNKILQLTEREADLWSTRQEAIQAFNQAINDATSHRHST